VRERAADDARCWSAARLARVRCRALSAQLSERERGREVGREGKREGDRGGGRERGEVTCERCGGEREQMDFSLCMD
jgi:hypothetical protein